MLRNASAEFDTVCIRRLFVTGLAACLLAACAAVPVLQFPSEPYRRVPNSRSAFLKPVGDGPFPAVVMLHTCGGVGQHLDPWMVRLRDAGYVVLLVDSFGPRGVGNQCGIFGVTPDDLAADAVAAAAHLRQLPNVDRDRLFVVGYSYGAMAALRLSSACYLAGKGVATPFRAVVSFYPFCTVDNFAGRYAHIQDNLQSEVATPTLMLLGGRDSEAPPGFCTGRADALAQQGMPIRYVVFPEATHAFDQTNATKGYRYNPDAVEGAWNEMRAFLGGFGKLSQK